VRPFFPPEISHGDPTFLPRVAVVGHTRPGGFEMVLPRPLLKTRIVQCFPPVRLWLGNIRAANINAWIGFSTSSKGDPPRPFHSALRPNPRVASVTYRVRRLQPLRSSRRKNPLGNSFCSRVAFLNDDRSSLSFDDPLPPAPRIKSCFFSTPSVVVLSHQVVYGSSVCQTHTPKNRSSDSANLSPSSFYFVFSFSDQLPDDPVMLTASRVSTYNCPSPVFSLFEECLLSSPSLAILRSLAECHWPFSIFFRVLWSLLKRLSSFFGFPARELGALTLPSPGFSQVPRCSFVFFLLLNLFTCLSLVGFDVTLISV